MHGFLVGAVKQVVCSNDEVVSSKGRTFGSVMHIGVFNGDSCRVCWLGRTDCMQ